MFWSYTFSQHRQPWIIGFLTANCKTSELGTPRSLQPETSWKAATYLPVTNINIAMVIDGTRSKLNPIFLSVSSLDSQHNSTLLCHGSTLFSRLYTTLPYSVMALPYSLDSQHNSTLLCHGSTLFLFSRLSTQPLHNFTLLYPGYILLHQTIILPYSFPWVWSLATAGLSISSITTPCLHELLVF